LLANSSPQQSAAAAAGVPCDVDWPSVDLYISDKLIFIYIMDIVHGPYIMYTPTDVLMWLKIKNKTASWFTLLWRLLQDEMSV
jgi:hypothetical protein